MRTSHSIRQNFWRFHVAPFLITKKYNGKFSGGQKSFDQSDSYRTSCGLAVVYFQATERVSTGQGNSEFPKIRSWSLCLHLHQRNWVLLFTSIITYQMALQISQAASWVDSTNSYYSDELSLVRACFLQHDSSWNGDRDHEKPLDNYLDIHGLYYVRNAQQSFWLSFSVFNKLGISRFPSFEVTFVLYGLKTNAVYCTFLQDQWMFWNIWFFGLASWNR